MGKPLAEKRWDSLTCRAKKKQIKIKWKKDDFIKWYDKQDKTCHYCKIKESNIVNIWGSFYGGKRKVLEIDRKSNCEYSSQNCVLACPLCNIAKSDKIGYKDFKNVGKVFERIWRKKIKETELRIK